MQTHQESLNARLFAAVKTHNLADIDTLIAAGADVNARDEIGNTPLYYAVLPKQPSMTHQESLNARLFEAVKENNIIAVEALIEAGADVNARDELGNTPLHYIAAFTTQHFRTH